MNGKGSSPRNLGPRFRKNFDNINWRVPTEGQRIARENRTDFNLLSKKERERLLKRALNFIHNSFDNSQT